MHGLVADLGVEQDHVVVFCDRQSVIHLNKNQAHHCRMKHIDVHFYFIHMIIDKGDVLLDKIGTTVNPLY